MAWMAEQPNLGPGESVTKARRKYQTRFLVGCGLFGAVIGAALVLGQPDPGHGLDPRNMTLAPWLSLLLAVLLLVGLVLVPASMFRKIDEVRVKRNLQAMAVGWFTLMGGYPIWLFLAAGSWLPRPGALGLFLLVYGTTLIAFVALKLRDKEGS